MVLWTFQIGLNFLFIAALIYGFRTRKKLLALEEKLEMAGPKKTLLETPSVSQGHVEEASLEKLELAEASRGAGLKVIDRSQAKVSPIEARLSAADRYDQAEQLIAKGVKIQDVASKTGLSVAEIRLLEKISTKSH